MRSLTTNARICAMLRQARRAVSRAHLLRACNELGSNGPFAPLEAYSLCAPRASAYSQGYSRVGCEIVAARMPSSCHKARALCLRLRHTAACCQRWLLPELPPASYPSLGVQSWLHAPQEGTFPSASHAWPAWMYSDSAALSRPSLPYLLLCGPDGTDVAGRRSLLFSA